MLERVTPSRACPRERGGRTATLSATWGAYGPPSPAGVPGSWTGPLRQEIPLHLQLADLLVQPGDQGGVVLGLLLLVLAEDPDSAFGEGFLPSLNLAGWTSYRAANWATVSWPFTASSATLALNAGLCFLLPFDISHSFPTATAALSLGAGLSLSYLSDFPGPPQR